MKQAAVAAFRGRLADLKREGCTLLVSGAVPDEVHERLCPRMLGDDDYAPRRRLLVTTDGDGRDALSRIPDTEGTPDEELVRVVTAPEILHRSTTASPGADPAAAPSIDAPVTRDVVESDNLADLGITISKAIRDIEEQANGLDAAELRVCFDSLVPLLDAYEEEQVFEFLHLVTHRIKTVDGMAHFHLARDPADETARLLAPLFDVLVELRGTGSEAQQRWHIQDADLTMEWFDL